MPRSTYFDSFDFEVHALALELAPTDDVDAPDVEGWWDLEPTDEALRAIELSADVAEVQAWHQSATMSASA